MKHKSGHCQPTDDISNYETRWAHQGNSHRWRRVDTEPWDPRTFAGQKEEKPRKENEKERTVK